MSASGFKGRAPARGPIFLKPIMQARRLRVATITSLRTPGAKLSIRTEPKEDAVPKQREPRRTRTRLMSLADV